MVKYTSPIDPHVHLRWKEYEQPFAQWAFEDARAVGLRAMIEQPNTDPFLTSDKNISDRMEVIDGLRDDIIHGIHAGFTPDLKQQREVMDLVDNKRVCSIKTFYVRSTRSGEIEITDEEDQREMWKNVVSFGYKGAMIGHFEDGNLFEQDVSFNFRRPITHSQHQRAIAEEKQVERQLKNAHDAGFEGTFVCLHTSSDRTIDYLHSIRSKVPFGIVIETTPHHMLLNWDDYDIHGNLLKMNPPLRPRYMQEGVFERVLAGKTDMIGTDHAPHPYSQKVGDPYKSGIPGIPIWPFFVEALMRERISLEGVKRLTFDTANEIYFGGKLKPREVDVEYTPQLWEKYGFNPFSRIDGTK